MGRFFIMTACSLPLFAFCARSSRTDVDRERDREAVGLDLHRVRDGLASLGHEVFGNFKQYAVVAG